MWSRRIKGKNGRKKNEKEKLYPHLKKKLYKIQIKRRGNLNKYIFKKNIVKALGQWRCFFLKKKVTHWFSSFSGGHLDIKLSFCYAQNIRKSLFIRCALLFLWINKIVGKKIKKIFWFPFFLLFSSHFLLSAIFPFILWLYWSNILYLCLLQQKTEPKVKIIM